MEYRTDQTSTSSVGSFLNYNGDTTRYQVIRIPFGSMKMSILPQVIDDKSYEVFLDEKREIVSEMAFLIKKRILPNYPHVSHFVLFYCPQEFEEDIMFIYKSLFPHDMVIFDLQIMLRHILEKYGIYLAYTEEEKNSTEKKIHNDELDQIIQKLQSMVTKLTSQGLLEKIDYEESLDERWLFVPLAHSTIQLSKHANRSNVLVNSHFFLMEIPDLLSPFDMIGEPFGLLQYEGKVHLPPLYARYGLFFSNDNTVSCRLISLFDIRIQLTYKDSSGVLQTYNFSHGLDDVVFYKKPEHSHCQKHSTLLIFSGAELIAIANHEILEIPNAGFIVGTDISLPHDIALHVTFIPESQHYFAIQTGPLVRNQGASIGEFLDDYYNRKGISFPPTKYPLDWHRDAAARILLGVCSRRSSIFLVWVEGCKQYKSMNKSEGASLEDTKRLSEILDIETCINLDGGGSSQIIFQGERFLDPADLKYDACFERPIGLGIEFR